MLPSSLKRKYAGSKSRLEADKKINEESEDESAFGSDCENLLQEIQNDDASNDENSYDGEASDSEDELSFESFDGEEEEANLDSEEGSRGFEEGNWSSDDEDAKKLAGLIENRKIQRTEQATTSAAIKENLRNSDEGHLNFLERVDTAVKEEQRKSGEKSIQEKDEYEEGDTSDEEDIRNTVGNVPLSWYDEYKHIGYDWDGNKIVKPPQRDQIDDFLKKMEDPDFWRTVKDPQTGQDVKLSEDDIQLIKQIMKQRNPDQTFDDYAPWIEWFTSEVEKMPIRNIPDSKSSFLPSKTEKQQVGRLVHSLKMGWMKTRAEQERIDKERKVPKFFMLWETDTDREKMRRIHDHVAAPKRGLPGHAESYNPPAEYLFNDAEKQEWDRLKEQPHKRKLHFVPQKFKSLRQVPYYDRYIRERFLRCLDLYLCPRAKRTKVTVQPEDLIPKLPSPRDLQPFPTVESMIFKGHLDLVRAISIEPLGQYIVTGSDDSTIKIWEILTGRCIKTIPTKGVVRSVAWCPNPKVSLIAVATDKRCLLINPHVGDIKLIAKKTDDILSEAPVSEMIENDKLKSAIQWTVEIDEDEKKDGVRVIINHFQEIKQVTWHGRGDYFATVMPSGLSRSVVIHQLSKRKSQTAFSKTHGLVQCVLFHPVKPCLFVATQQHVRIYDLVKQELIKKLVPTCKWISKIAIHPKGDNLLVSSYDKKMMWFDLDLSTKPYQTLKLHSSAVRSVAYHPRYPLFASGSDDRGVIVCHGMVYNDLLQNPLIVPLKRLDYHEKQTDYGVFEVLFHNTQPWLFSAGSDHTVRLYS